MALLNLLKEGIDSKEIPITVTKKEFEELKKFFGKEGANINFLLKDNDKQLSENEESDKKENPKKYYSIDNSTGNITFYIPNEVDEILMQLYEKGKDLQDWYITINKLVFDSFKEEDGVLFLMLLASTSVKNNLSANFKEASIIYTGLKYDLKRNRKLLKKLLEDTTRNDKFKYDEPPYDKLEFIKNMRIYGVSNVSSKIGNIKKTISLFFYKTEPITRKNVIEYYISNFNPYGTNNTKKINFKNTLSSYKIFNFVLNLLDPNAVANIQGENWYFITLDTWMFRALYAITKEQSASINKTIKQIKNNPNYNPNVFFRNLIM